MYTFFLAVHNILRWIALILAIIVLVRAYWGWFGGREWTSTDRRVGSFYSISLDVQILLGLLLYFVFSPITRAALSNFPPRRRRCRQISPNSHLDHSLLHHPLVGHALVPPPAPRPRVIQISNSKFIANN
jgi:hypothetical protein